MTKWEYATVPLLVHATKQILDNWGDDGWELVAVVPGPNPEQLVAPVVQDLLGGVHQQGHGRVLPLSHSR